MITFEQTDANRVGTQGQHQVVMDAERLRCPRPVRISGTAEIGERDAAGKFQEVWV